MSQLHRPVDKRVNIIAAKRSEELGNAKIHMFRLCDGSAKKPVYAVLPSYHSTTENEAIVAELYGAILELDNVLVRYNPKHDAYNVLVSRNTGIAPVK